jgi:Fur family peroxide stress response transcriptional regulator
VQKERIAEKLREFEALCRREGLPLTVQRRTILEALLEREDHPTADQVFEMVESRVAGVSRTTVYRALETLVRLGVIRRIHHPGTSARFDGKTYRHHHLVCMYCSRVIDFEDCALDRLALPDCKPQGFEIEDFSVQFTGTCADCRRRLSADVADSRVRRRSREGRR